MLDDILPNRWYPILESERLRLRPVTVNRLGERLALWRADGVVMAALDRCPHRGVSFARGRVSPQGELECPYHGFRFGRDGACTLAPVLGRGAKPPAMSLDLRAVTEAHGLVWLYTGQVDADTPAPPWFDGVGEDRARHAQISEEWPVHHVQLTQSMFDMYHVRFAHRWSAPGVGAVVDDYEVEVQGEDRVRTRGALRKEDGGEGLRFTVELVLPGFLCIDFAGFRFKVLIGVTPVDGQRSWIWARYEQSWTRLPGLGRLVAWAAMQYDFLVVQHTEDLPLLTSITPAAPQPGLDRLVRADGGAAAYLRLHRQALRAAA